MTSPPSPGGWPRVAVLIPALDEEASLPGVLEALPWEALDRVVVVDNGSRDRTAEVARAGGARVVREGRRGYGAACLAGLAHLAADPPDLVVFLDADHSDSPGSMGKLLRPLVQRRAGLTLGVRRGPDEGTGSLLPHARAGNRLILGLVRLLFGQRWSDLPPYRAVTWEALRALEMDDRTWGWTLQMQIRAGVEGVPAEEVPLSHRRRVRGRSKISGSLVTSVRVGLRMFWTLARERFRAWRRRGSRGVAPSG